MNTATKWEVVDAAQTVRSYPRTLQQAFPKTAEYADPLERYRSQDYTPAWWAAVVCIAIAGAIVVWVTR